MNASHPAEKSTHMLIDQRLATDDLLTADVERLGGNLLQTVDVVEEDPFHLVNGGIGVTRDGKINDEERRPSAKPQQGSELFRGQDGMRSIGGTDQNVDVSEGFFPMVEMQRHPANLRGKFSRALIGAVGDDDTAHPSGLETSCRALTDLTGSQDHDAAILQGSKNLPSKLDRHGSHGSRAARDLGLCPDRFRDSESMLEKFVERSCCGSSIGGRGVGLLDLSKDLGFTDHHGIKAARHPEEMPHGLRRDVMVERGFQTGAFREDRTKSIKRPEGTETRGIELHTIAGGEHDGAGDSLNGSQAPEQFLHFVLTHGKPLTHVEMSGTVIEACAEDIHHVVFRGP